MKIHKNQRGLGSLEVLIVLVIVGLVGFAGWYVWQSKNKADNTYNPAIATTTKETLYTRWKTYCDGLNRACFKHPKNWATVDQSTASEANVSYRANTLEVNYINPFKDSENGPGTFYTVQIIPLSGKYSGLTVLGGIFTSANNQPFYLLVDSSFVKDKSLAVGKSSQLDTGTAFTNKNGQSQGSLTVTDVPKKVPVPIDEAKNWFKSKDAQTALNVIKSLYWQ